MFCFALSFRLADVYCPLLILHDRDDEIISFELGKKVNIGVAYPFQINLQELLDFKCYIHVVDLEVR